MKLSRQGEYALKALIYLAEKRTEVLAPATEISASTGIPEPFLNQILLKLKRHRIVRSQPGFKGGYTLAKPADEITLGSVIRLIDGPLAPIACASVTAYEVCPTCINKPHCKLQRLMRKVRDAVSELIDTATIAEVAERKTRDSAD